MSDVRGLGHLASAGRHVQVEVLRQPGSIDDACEGDVSEAHLAPVYSVIAFEKHSAILHIIIVSRGLFTLGNG